MACTLAYSWPLDIREERTFTPQDDSLKGGPACLARVIYKHSSVVSLNPCMLPWGVFEATGQSGESLALHGGKKDVITQETPKNEIIIMLVRVISAVRVIVIIIIMTTTVAPRPAHTHTHRCFQYPSFPHTKPRVSPAERNASHCRSP